MAKEKSTRKKKEPAVTEVSPQHDSETLVIETSDTSGPVIVSTQEPAPETDIPASQQPANTATPDQATQPAVQQTAPAVVTYQVVEAKFRTELTRMKYEEALQSLTSYVITVDNIAEAQNKLTRAKRFITQMDEIKAKGKKPAWDECKFWDESFNSLKKPLEEQINIKSKNLNEIAAEQARKKLKQEIENQRIEGIKATIDGFIIDQSQEIAACKNNDSLIHIQKVIGSHKANKARYQEFLPDLITRAEALNELIKQQKKTIDDLEELEKAKLEAEKKGDDATLIALEDKKDDLIQKIEENKVVVQEVAINQATKAEAVTIAQPIHTTIAARRTVWKAQLVKKPDGSLDQKELEKAFKAGLLICEIDPAKTRTVLDTLKSSGSLKDKTEIVVNGIRYYEEKTY